MKNIHKDFMSFKTLYSDKLKMNSGSGPIPKIFSHDYSLHHYPLDMVKT